MRRGLFGGGYRLLMQLLFAICHLSCVNTVLQSCCITIMLGVCD